MQISLSVVIITFNEERNIGRCIESVKEIADDIVVLDSFSTDSTAEICKEKGVRFFQHDFDGHIEQKNRAITYAQYPHILSLDADEAPDERLVESIKYIKDNWCADGYYMNRLTNYCGKWIRHSSWYPDKKLRLWDSRKGRWGGVNPHDRYEMNENASLSYLKGNILHYSYYSIEEHKQQADKFSDIAARAYFNKGKKGNIVKMSLNPLAKFIKMFILRAGFLDGKAGFTIALISAKAVYNKYDKLRKLYTNSGQQ